MWLCTDPAGEVGSLAPEPGSLTLLFGGTLILARFVQIRRQRVQRAKRAHSLSDGVEGLGGDCGSLVGRAQEKRSREHGRCMFMLALTVVPLDPLLYGLRTILTAVQLSVRDTACTHSVCASS